jgi:3'(2'), 5'-bisphosphate nucleotidase
MKFGLTLPQVTIPAHLTDNDVQFVCNLARRAGKLAASMRDGVAISEKTGPQDKVTAADIELSKLIVGELNERFPRDVVISEEGNHPTHCNAKDRIWLIDPIDGTDNYIRNDGQYAVMIGLLVEMQPVFGWVYAPVPDQIYYGGPDAGAWEGTASNIPSRINQVEPLASSAGTRIMMGFRDRKSHPWVHELSGVEFIKSGSVGLKVAKVLGNQADMFIHLSGKLKVWDTAGPVAIALGAGLEVGRLDADELGFPLPDVQHHCSVIIGRSGSLAWSRKNLVRTQS